jgi:hypothetical protein
VPPAHSRQEDEVEQHVSAHCDPEASLVEQSPDRQSLPDEQGAPP